MEINNREIAFLILVIFFANFMLFGNNSRSIVKKLLKSLMNYKIQLLILSAGIWVLACSYLMHKLELWSADNLKSTIIWFITVAIASIFRSHQSDGYVQLYNYLIRDAIGIGVLVSFVSGIDSFNLYVELLFLSVIIACALYSAKKIRIKKINFICNFAPILIGLLCIGNGIFFIYSHVNDKFFHSAIIDAINPILLSILFIPALFLFYSFASYERLFIVINFFIKDRKICMYTKYKTIYSFLFDFDLLRRFKREICSAEITSYEDVDNIISEIKSRKLNEKKQQIVHRIMGWSPFVAKNYLSDNGIETSDYHPLDGETWCANSNIIEIGDGILKNTVQFYVYGDRNFAKKLKIELYVNNSNINDVDELYFASLCIFLYKKSVGVIKKENLNDIVFLKSFEIDCEERKIKLKKEEFIGGYSYIFTVERIVG